MNDKHYLVKGWFLKSLLEYFQKKETFSFVERYIESVLEDGDAEELLEAKELLDFLENNATLRQEECPEGESYWWEVAYLPEIISNGVDILSFKDYIHTVRSTADDLESITEGGSGIDTKTIH